MTLFRHRMIGGLIGGETWQCGLYTMGTATLDSAQTTWVSAVQQFFTTGVLALYSPDVTCTEASTVSIDETTGGQQNRLDDPLTLSGSSTSPSLPPQVALCVSFKSAQADKKTNGRFYLPSMATNAVDAGMLSADAQNEIQGGANTLWAQLNTGGLTLTLWSTTRLASRPIVQGRVGSVFDTQRRRRNKLAETWVELTPPS